MKQLFLLFTLLLALTSVAQTPARLFDVRNGNGIVDNAVAQPFATYIAYKDSASKNKIIDAFATAYGYQANIPDPANPGQTIPNPQSKQGFFNARLTAYIKDVYKAQQVATAAKTASDTAASAADAEVPPQ